MRVAALYDIHGMPWALEAVLAEVERERVDAIVVGGDFVGGPQPRETLDVLERLDDERVLYLRGNGERELVDGRDAPAIEWTREQLPEDVRTRLANLPLTQQLEIDGLGRVLFCHATPRSDIEVVTEATPDEHLRKVVEDVDADVIVCGHTHMQLDRRVDGVRWVNAGSVGMPYEGEVAAFWALLGPGVELRNTSFDTEAAAEAILATTWPMADEFVRENVREAVRREDVVPLFEQLAIERGER